MEKPLAKTQQQWYHGLLSTEKDRNTSTHDARVRCFLFFAEADHSIAMIKHAITVVMKPVEHLNPGQAAVIAFDQPLYALAKQIQWRYPDTMGEDKLVVMLGGLHRELAVLKAIGSWLLGSGWTEAVAQAGIATTGRAESLVTSAHYYAYKIRP